MRVSWSCFAAVSTLAGAATAGAQQPLTIAYQFRADRPATHLGEVTLRVSGATPESTLIQFPAWYPGRYAIYNFAANVQDARATCDGAAAPAPKLDKQTWLVRCPAGGTGEGRPAAITFAFRVWWDDLTGSHSQIDSLHANLNPGNIFPYVVGHKADPVTVTYAGPPGWLVVNGASAAPAPGPVTQVFPNYDLLIDHPTEISSRFTVDTFRVGRVPYRVVLHAEEGDATARAPLVEGIRRIVTAEVAMWGDPPLPGYTFLLHFIPGNRLGGDGMEHLTSTQIISASRLDGARLEETLGTVAHEFFHTWNMKRLRARELGPWDYTRENHTTTLWVGEGFTNYYGERMFYRAGLTDRDGYLAAVAAAVTELQGRPGRHLMSAQQSSFHAWFFDRVRLLQQTNLPNTAISYYNKGEVLGWLLDLEVRAHTAGAKTLDDVLRLLWERCWNGATTSYYLQGHGYTDADVLQALNDVTGGDFADFFRRYIEGVDELPYDATLARVGLVLAHEGGRYRLRTDPGASGAARRLGQTWLEGR